MRPLRSSAALAALLLATTPAAYAQETTATVRGEVVDASGAPVSGAAVTIRHEPSGTVSRTTTDAQGQYSASGLRVGGPFTVTASSPGLDDAVANEIQLTQGEVTRVPLQLQPVAIVVTGSRTRTAPYNLSTGPATVINAEDIKSIASINRDIRDLARRSPLVTLDPNTRAVVVAGNQGRFNRFTIDGARFNDPFGLNNGGLPTPRGPVPLDAVEQLQVKIAPYDVTEGDALGAAINLVTRSGQNTFTGSAFYTYLGPGMVGGRSGRPGQPPSSPTFVNTFRNQNFQIESNNFGGLLRGPIIKDKLFFMFSYERLQQTTPLANGFGPGVGNQVPNLTQALIDRTTSLAQQLFQYDTLGPQQVGTENDEKAVARIDWNVTDGQRLSFTYLYQDNTDDNQQQNTSILPQNPGLGLFSNGYVLGQTQNAGVLQLSSQWSDRFSTEARVVYRNYDRTQVPNGDRNFAQIRVCATETTPAAAPFNVFNQCFAPATGAPVPPLISFGPDISRQANLLNVENWTGDLLARYQAGEHIIKFNFVWQHQDVYNLFVQNATGNYFFRSFAELQARTPTQLVLQLPVGGADPAARYKYNQFTFAAQDSWDITDTFNLTYGIRYDFFLQETVPALNPFFTARVGFNNQTTYDGLDLIQPRIGFTWKADPRTVVRGGFGLFGAGTPDVWLSNSFSNTGILTNTVNFQRTAAGGFTSNATGVPAAVSAAASQAALTGVDGRAFPAVVTDFIQNNTLALQNSTTNALSPNVELPSQYKASISVDRRFNLGRLGDDWNFGVDFLYQWVNNGFDYIDARVQRCSINAVDGRPRYVGVGGNLATCTGGFGGPNADLVVINEDRGRSINLVVRIDKRWDFGGYFNVAYTYSDVQDVNNLNSAVALSNYINNVFADPNSTAFGRSSLEVRNQIKFTVGYDKAFFGDYKTRFQIFGEWRNGFPYSLTMTDTSPLLNGRSSLFGVVSSGNRNLLYVPNLSSITADPLVVYDSPATFNALQQFAQQRGLRQGIVNKNSQTNPDWFKVDLRFSQEIPLPKVASFRPRATVFLDIENVLNLINNEWGQLRQVPFPGNAPVVNVTCATIPVPATGCTQYRYSNFNTPQELPLIAAAGQPVSVWGLRIGARFDF